MQSLRNMANEIFNTDDNAVLNKLDSMTFDNNTCVAYVDESGMIKSSVNAEHSVNEGAISFGGSLYLKLDAKKLLTKVASKLPLVGQLFAAQPTSEDGKQ